MAAGTLEMVLQCDRIDVADALAGLAALAWAYVLWLAAEGREQKNKTRFLFR
jgi:predicted metal-binding membrane protein